MIHYSTDYVFDGSKTTPYVETDPTCPINVYGVTKLVGEHAIQAARIPHLILRTSRVYGVRGNNFLHTIPRLAQERDELRIVADQRGAPTWCRTIADTTANIVAQSKGVKHRDDWWQQRRGVYNLTAQGQTTWYGFTQAILGNSSISHKLHLTPIAIQNYPSPTKRPTYSIMSCDRLSRIFCGLPAWKIR